MRQLYLMSFKGIGKSIHPMGATTRWPTPPPHRLDEFPAGYSSAGCSPAGPASASPTEPQYATAYSCRSIRLSRPTLSLTTTMRPLSFHVSHGWGAFQCAVAMSLAAGRMVGCEIVLRRSTHVEVDDELFTLRLGEPGRSRVTGRR
jgi:hypothetical protein